MIPQLSSFGAPFPVASKEISSHDPSGFVWPTASKENAANHFIAKGNCLRFPSPAAAGLLCQPPQRKMPSHDSPGFEATDQKSCPLQAKTGSLFYMKHLLFSGLCCMIAE
ncbi:hypothetical protein BIZ35_15945 [Heyndrickxia coagulans]|nr:hypothetical protein BIZ35_15945 [Heyndrickxia coagulans]